MYAKISTSGCWNRSHWVDACIVHAQMPLRWRHNGRHSVSNHQPHDCFLNRLFRRRSKKTSKLRVTGLCAGNSPGTGEFPAQMASNTEKVSIWWRHHGMSIWRVVLPGWWCHACYFRRKQCMRSVVYITKEVNPNLAKPLLKFSGGLARLGSPPNL